MNKLTFAGILLFSVTLALNSQQKAFNMNAASTKGTSFSLALAAVAESTAIQIDWGDGKPIDYTLGTSPSEITGSIAGDYIQVYGKGISHLNVNSKNLTLLDVKTASDLKELYCSSNSLSVLDVSNLKELVILNCSSNQIAELNVKNSPGLKYLYCNSNLLTSLDLSKNPLLNQLYCSSNYIGALDVSANPELKALFCSSNKLTSLDLSNNLLLTNLNCSSNSISDLNVTSNTALTYLWCYSNLLSGMDVSKNTLLSSFNCSSNNIRKIDITNNTALIYFTCSSNKLTFSTLPLMTNNAINYTYSPQQPVEMPKTVYNLGEIIDLSAQLASSIRTTVFTWKTLSSVVLVAGVDYEESNGIFKFINIPTEEIYCQMTNISFPNLVLKTEKISISYATQLLKIPASLNIYPNPVKEYLSIESPEEIKKIELYSLSGKLVFSENTNGVKSAFINLSNTPKGIFVLKIYGEASISQNKIFKQ
jgi:Leucine-rich repeat (LRR) protein